MQTMEDISFAVIHERESERRAEPLFHVRARGPSMANVGMSDSQIPPSLPPVSK